MKNVLRHLSSFIAPLVMSIIIPYLIISIESQTFSRPVFTSSWLLRLLGLAIIIIGLVLLLMTIRMFILIGNGTIMPWDPTRNLITGSLYAYVRNPMILSLIIVHAGLAILFASRGIAILAILNFMINTIYFKYSEEPGLEKRFGDEYSEYKKNVPRWIPRLKPWRSVPADRRP